MSGVVRVEYPPILFTKELAAHFISVSTREIDVLRATGALIAVGEGKRAYFRLDDLRRYADSLPERDDKRAVSS